MYTLTLTRAERNAFDWIGNRYSNGNDMSDYFSECLKEDESWDDDGDLVFNIPESIAWEIKELAENDDMLFPCFADALRIKMTQFVDNIV